MYPRRLYTNAVFLRSMNLFSALTVKDIYDDVSKHTRFLCTVCQLKRRIMWLNLLLSLVMVVEKKWCTSWPKKYASVTTDAPKLFKSPDLECQRNIKRSTTKGTVVRWAKAIGSWYIKITSRSSVFYVPWHLEVPLRLHFNC